MSNEGRAMDKDTKVSSASKVELTEDVRDIITYVWGLDVWTLKQQVFKKMFPKGNRLYFLENSVYDMDDVFAVYYRTLEMTDAISLTSARSGNTTRHGISINNGELIVSGINLPIVMYRAMLLFYKKMELDYEKGIDSTLERMLQGGMLERKRCETCGCEYSISVS